MQLLIDIFLTLDSLYDIYFQKTDFIRCVLNAN